MALRHGEAAEAAATACRLNSSRFNDFIVETSNTTLFAGVRREREILAAVLLVCNSFEWWFQKAHNIPENFCV